jgi:hypothetical protein
MELLDSQEMYQQGETQSVVGYYFRSNKPEQHHQQQLQRHN